MMWYNSKYFKFLTSFILILLIVYLLGKIDYALMPIKNILATVLAPILSAGLLYYLLKPLVSILCKLRVPKVLSVLITFIALFVFLFLMITYTGSSIAEQFTGFIEELPKYIVSVESTINQWINADWFIEYNIIGKASDILEHFVSNADLVFLGIFSTLTNIGTVVALTPFVLFFFLKDDHKFESNIRNFIPKKHQKDILIMISDINRVLSAYISGQILVALAIGLLMFIGYLIIGLKYSLLLAFFAMITCIIPFFGAFLGIIPAILIGIAEGPFMIIKIIIVSLIAQQIEGNFISPQIMGKKLKIHPLTVIMMLMIGSTLFGFVGLIFAIPLYAAIKITVSNIQQLYFSQYIDKDITSDVKPPNDTEKQGNPPNKKVLKEDKLDKQTNKQIIK